MAESLQKETVDAFVNPFCMRSLKTEYHHHQRGHKAKG